MSSIFKELFIEEYDKLLEDAKRPESEISDEAYERARERFADRVDAAYQRYKDERRGG